MRYGWDSWDKAIFAMAGFLITFGVVQILLLTDAYATGVLLICQGLLIGVHRWHLRIAHNHAWIMGRATMAGSLSEALRRGMHPVDFVIAEAERDGAQVRIVRRGEEE